jgi:hypothetical protein
VQLVNQTFNTVYAAAILSIPIVDDMEDFLAWQPDSRGMFFVKSAYKLHITPLHRQRNVAESSTEEGRDWKQKVWKQIWKTECPPKVQHFLWRFSHNSHPLHMNIQRRGVELDTRCVVCNEFFEDGGHLFLKCKDVKPCWRTLDLEAIRVRLCACPSPMDILEQVFALPSEIQMRVIALLWCWWRERNKVNHQERRLTTAEFQFMTLRHCDEWKEFLAKKPKSAAPKVQHWTPPPPDVFKINLDGAIRNDTRRGGWGAIGRSHSGEPIFAACGYIPVAVDALQAELLALINAIPVAEQFGASKVTLAMVANDSVML